MDRRELINDEQEALRMAMEGRLSSLWTAIPGIVQDVDLIKMVVSIQPSIQVRIQNPDQSYAFVNLPLLLDVPIVFQSSTDFTLTFPIKAGDEALVIFSKQCIDSWWESGGVNNVPLELRTFDLSDGFAIIGPRSFAKKIANISTANVQLRHNNGNTFFELTPSGTARLKATTITLEGNVIVTGTTTLQQTLGVTGIATFQTNVIILGTLAVTGAITGVGGLAITGTSTMTGDLNTSGTIGAASIVSGGKAFNGHTHSGVTTGGGNTGGPN